MAKQPKTLPDPVLADAPVFCVNCQYSLAGLEQPSVCPECGTPVDQTQLIFVGVPKTAASRSPLRTAAWACTLTVLVVEFFLLQFVIALSPLFALVLAVLSIGSMVALIATSPRERQGVARFVLSRHGVTHMPLKAAEGVPVDTVHVPWGNANMCHITRVSAFWRRIRIGAASPITGALATTMFDAGVRCPDAQEDAVRAAIESLLRGEPLAPASLTPSDPPPMS